MTYYEIHRAAKEGKTYVYGMGFVSLQELDKPIATACSVHEAIAYIVNPLNKIKIKFFDDIIELSGKTYDLKEDLKKWFHAKWNPAKKCWNISSSFMNEIKKKQNL